MRPALAPFLALACAAPAAAQEFRPVADRDFAIDLYSGAALGSLRTIGMGGAAVAIAEGSVGALANPASPAVRAETSTGTWDWDWHLEAQSTGIGTDADNNGVARDGGVDPVTSAGLVVQRGAWGLGASITVATSRIAAPDRSGALEPSALLARATLARSLADDQLTVGLALRSGMFALSEVVGGRTSDLFALRGASFEAGALWRPRDVDLRVGLAASLPVAGDEVDVADGCDPLDCAGFIIPERAVVPWQIAGGVALRLGPTRWNRRVRERWRDERYTLLAADLVVTGRVAGGHGLEAYGAGELQPSGRTTVVSPRGGVEHEWRPGWLRVRAGSYWEPSRFRDPGGRAVPGRLHATFGIDGRIWSFCLLREPYRLRLSLSADVAERYGNGGLSIGLWH